MDNLPTIVSNSNVPASQSNWSRNFMFLKKVYLLLFTHFSHYWSYLSTSLLAALVKSYSWWSNFLHRFSSSLAKWSVVGIFRANSTMWSSDRLWTERCTVVLNLYNLHDGILYDYVKENAPFAITPTVVFLSAKTVTITVCLMTGI